MNTLPPQVSDPPGRPRLSPRPPRAAAQAWDRVLVGLVAALVLLMSGLRLADLRRAYPAPVLLLALNFVFGALTSAFVAYLVGRSFRVRSRPGLLLLGCGVVLWGASGVVANVVGWHQPNLMITVHNLCAALSALCHFSGVLLALQRKRTLEPAGLWLAAGYGLALVAVAGVTGAALAGWLPPFFVQGYGGTPVRQLVAGLTGGLFAFTAALLGRTYRSSGSSFLKWYGPALVLLAVSFYGALLQPAVDSWLNWTVRLATWLGGLYMLRAGLTTAHDAQAWSISLEAALQASEEQRRELSQRLEYHVEHSPLAVIEWGPDMRLIRWSGAAERVFGWKAEEVLGKRIEEFRWVVEEDQRQVDAVSTELQTGRNTNRFSANRNYRKDGSVIYCEWYNSSLLDEAGQLRSVLSLVLDVTERRRAEQALQEAQAKLQAYAQSLEQTVAARTAKLQETISDLEHFSYAIVHDMRAPLRAMQGFAELLEAECAHCVHPHNLDYYQRIKRAAHRMDRLITDSLNYSRAVRQELPLHPVNLSGLLRDLVETYPNLQPEQAHIELPPELPAVLGNEAALTQCFSNLLGNAVKFAKPGTKPRIRVWAEPVRNAECGMRNDSPAPAEPVRNAECGVRNDSPAPAEPVRNAECGVRNEGPADGCRSGDSALRTPHSALVRVWVEDDGLGVPANARQRIFDLFQRAHSAQEGTGIGLAVVRKVVQRMGGQVGVESEHGQGSRFWVELPQADGALISDAGPRLSA